MRTLSKSDFKAARSCDAKLYYRELSFPSTKDDDPYLAMLAEGGYIVEAMAKLQFPDGIALSYGRDTAADAAATMEHLAKENVTLFEATLLVGNRLARADVIRKVGNDVHLIEVKAKSIDGAENARRLAAGQPNVFRNKTRPFAVSAAWRDYLEDVAFQCALLRALLPNANVRPFLCLVDKSSVAIAEGLNRNFKIVREATAGARGRVHHVEVAGDAAQIRAEKLLSLFDVTAEVDEMAGEVEEVAVRLESSFHPELRRLPVDLTVHCRDCEYRVDSDEERNGFRECWGALADVQPSVLDLYQVGQLNGADGPLANDLIAAKTVSLFDVSDDACRKKDGTIGAYDVRRLLQLEHTRSGKPWYGSELPGTIAGVAYPLHFLDFEATRIAIPYHAGMRPYGLVAFQWSCHEVAAPGEAPTHSEWLNDSNSWPNEKFLEALRGQIGEAGTVMTWSPYEASTVRDIVRDLEKLKGADPELVAWAKRLTDGDRILDLNKIALKSFFYPGMAGRTSIKVVLDALWKGDSILRARHNALTGRDSTVERGPYKALPPLTINGTLCDVAEGTGAMRAYEAMMFGVESESPDIRAAWRALLLEYCKLDTLAMLLIWEHWERAIAVRTGT
jgi:hypothetical protein